MKKKIFNIVFFVFALFILTGCNKEKERKLIIGMSPDYPPFAFEYNREFIGFDVELTRAICTRLGYQAEFKKMKFEDLFLALENKNVDLIVSAISKTDEREKRFDFSHSYYSPKFALIYKRENARKIHSIDNIEGLIGVEKETTMADDIKYHFGNHESKLIELNDNEEKLQAVHKTSINPVKFISTKQIKKEKAKIMDEKIDEIKEEQIDENLKEHSVKLYNSHSDLLKALEKDEVAAIFTEVLQAEVATQNDRDLTFIPVGELDAHQHEYQYGFVFNKNSKLTEKFNTILDEMDSEGKIDILKLRWFSGYGMYKEIGKD